MADEKILKVYAKGFTVFQDAVFNEEFVAEMREAVYEKLIADFPGADIHIVEEQNNGE